VGANGHCPTVRGRYSEQGALPGWRPRGRGENPAASMAAFQLPKTRATVCREGWFSPA
jgi:hypothetical protein